MFKYTEYKVSKSLAALVKKLWTLDNLNNPSPVKNKSILPNGCFNIAFIAGAGVLIRNKNGKIPLPEGIYFCGQMTELLDIDIHPYSKATMVQLYPWTPTNGFYDQAHFNNSFQSMVKTSPNKFSINDCFLSYKK